MSNLKFIQLLFIFLLLLLLVCPFQLSKVEIDSPIQQVVRQEEQKLTGGSITNYESWSNDSFARSTQLVTVFDYISSSPVILKNITKKVNNTASYVIYNAKTKLYYHNQNQTAQFFVPDKIVAIADGWAEVKIDFSWIKTGPVTVSGSGTAQGYSEQIAIGFRFNDKSSSFAQYQIVDYLPFSCRHLNLTQIDGKFTQEDKQHLSTMLSNYPSNQTLSFQLQTQVAPLLSKYLGWFFNDKSPITNQQFSYTWANPAASSTIQTYKFTRDPFFLVFQNATIINYGYWNNIDDYPNPPYGPKIPAKNYQPQIYGTTQSYITLQFVQNLLHTAAQKNQLDTTLQRRFWGSRYFNFMAQEIYQPYPSLKKITIPETQIAGQCKADRNSIQVSRFSQDTLNVSITSQCSMSVLLLRERRDFTEFEIKLDMLVQVRPYGGEMDFWLKEYSEEMRYFPMEEFPMVDKAAVDKVIGQALKKLLENKLFGSGWPLYPYRFLAGIVIDDDEMLIYDKFKR